MEKSGDTNREANMQRFERVEKPLRLLDVVEGLVAVLAQKGIHFLSAADDRMDKSMQLLFPSITQLAAERRLDVRFRIQLHPLHGDSLAVQDALTSATYMGLITWDSPGNRDMRIKLNPETAKALLGRLPGDSLMYEELAKEFLQHYNGVPLRY